jgi:cytochrome bd ubiquinol oxidase subunit I
LLVAVSGAMSAVFVVTANAWMNAPAGFKILDGKITEIDPIAAMLNKASFHEALHMTLAAFVATGFAAAAVHAFFLLRDRSKRFHRCALGIALAVAAISAPLQLLSGDLSAKAVGRLQPAKLAAMEADYRTETGPPLVIGGLPNNETRTTDYALRIPHGLSFLLTHKFDSKVDGLENFPRSDWPNVRIVHWSFDLMVGSGMTLFILSAAAGWLCWRHRRLPDAKWFLRGLVACGPLGFVAIEAGWVVTEAGRQPWIIYGVMRTEAAVTPMPGIAVSFATFTALYVFLGIVVILLLRRQFLQPSNPIPAPPSIHA